jgi:CRP/FNR family transcriptional regulator, cyclic AMP receptor protein
MMNASEFLLPLVPLCQTRRFKKGMLLIQEGDDAGPLYILLKGKVRAFSYSEDGKEVTYGIYTPIDLIGEMSLDGGTRSASVITQEDCECAVLPASQLKAQLSTNSDLSFWIIERVIQRARASTIAARNMALLNVYGRLKAFLETQAFPAALNADQPNRFTHQDIAHQVGASREMISKLMKDLESGGYIAIAKKNIQQKKLLPEKW